MLTNASIRSEEKTQIQKVQILNLKTTNSTIKLTVMQAFPQTANLHSIKLANTATCTSNLQRFVAH
jgi:hypothetical protein